jgi:dimethylhistidine N-methyltransferase
MRNLQCGSVALRDYHPAQGLLIADVLQSLRRTPKQLAPMYFYDERGSQLFDQICELPEYYPTRTETGILQVHGDDIAQCISPNALLVEFGSGASQKTRLVLDRLPELAAYVPVDISRSHLLAAAKSISASYPCLEVLPVCADFTQTFVLPKPARTASRVVVFFPGSTIGNFDQDAAIDLLKVMRKVVGPKGGLVIGVDLVKDIPTMQRAYDDAAGVTAAFNLNVLRRLNREFGANFDLTSFRHLALWNAEASRIEMHLVSTRKQVVSIAGESIPFAQGEHLVTEHCHKYTEDRFLELAESAGWAGKEIWMDERRLFSVHYLESSAIDKMIG